MKKFEKIVARKKRLAARKKRLWQSKYCLGSVANYTIDFFEIVDFAIEIFFPGIIPVCLDEVGQ